jgi:hypothetical protein
VTAAHPTQVHRPWRATVRTIFQALIGLAAMADPIYSAATNHDPATATGYAAAALAISAGITRVMALPGVEGWLQRFLPFLSADGGQKRDAKGRFVKEDGSVALVLVLGVALVPLLVTIPHAYWSFWVLVLVLAGFAVPEGIAIANKQGGDTLSENIRRWLRTDTPGGGKTWLGVWATLLAVAVWLGGHILEWWA